MLDWTIPAPLFSSSGTSWVFFGSLSCWKVQLCLILSESITALVPLEEKQPHTSRLHFRYCIFRVLHAESCLLLHECTVSLPKSFCPIWPHYIFPVIYRLLQTSNKLHHVFSLVPYGRKGWWCMKCFACCFFFDYCTWFFKVFLKLFSSAPLDLGLLFWLITKLEISKELLALKVLMETFRAVIFSHSHVA